ncbi:AI-2E family transporter, partial [Streptomyces sp. GXMU-J5]|nr:AI-2E family transporter [Streptomyces beihaiensis]
MRAHGGKGRIMSRVPGWLDRLGAGISKAGARLEERRAEAERAAEADLPLAPQPVP